MTEQEMQRRCNILLSLQRVLVGKISPNLQAVTMDSSTNSISLYFFFTGEPSKENREDIQAVSREVQMDFPDDTIQVECISLAPNAPLPNIGKEGLFIRKGIYSAPKN